MSIGKSFRCGVLLIAILAVGCNQSQKNTNTNTTGSNKQQDTSRKQKKEEVEKNPVDVNKAVATFTQNMDDEVTNNDFIVNVYPTTTQNYYKVVIEYGANKAQDKIEFPPRQFYKEIALRKGKTNGECILGFIGNDGEFNEMNLISGSTTQIKIKALKAYYFTPK